MTDLLLCWIGDTDLRCAGIELPRRAGPVRGVGPIADAVMAHEYDRVLLLNSREPTYGARYKKWLRERTKAEIEVRPVAIDDVSDHAEIYDLVAPICAAELERGADLTYHLSPGTSAMAAVWLLLGKTRFPGSMVRSSLERGVQPASVPFDIAAELLPEFLREPGASLERRSAEHPPTSAAFADIIHRSKEMREAVSLAQRIAPWPVSVLIEGESGTGKELFARAIHGASARSTKSFVAVNCGAIPRELVESELFGHVRGAFSGARSDRPGLFEQADSGTLFLDEIAELPLDAQVKLLRALENGEVRRVGADESREVDVRVIAATHRSLAVEVAAGRFREDLFYRLAVAHLPLPPLRARGGDLSLLIDHALDQVNRDGERELPAFVSKKLCVGAKNILMRHRWPGNVRELFNTLRRAAIWSDGATITKHHAQRSLFEAPGGPADTILERPFSPDFELSAVLAEVARHYIERALEDSAGVKTAAAKLLGMGSYQTLNNWMKKYGVED